LIARNENIIGSNHPWKRKLIAQLGATATERASESMRHFESVKVVLGESWWETENYNPAIDPFYRRLITIINSRNIK
jgi:hypothetical protein